MMMMMIQSHILLGCDTV